MKWLKIIGIIVLVVFVLFVAIVATQPYRKGLEINSKIAAIKANGDPVCGKDFILNIPDSRNGALVYERVFAMIESDKAIIEKASYVTSSSKLKANPELLALSRKLAAKHRSILPLVEEAASYPQYRFTVDWNRPPELVLFRYSGKVRSLAKLLSEIAVVDAKDGRMNDSIRVIKSSYNINESLKQEPSLISFLLRCSCIKTASKTLKSSMQYGDISEAKAHDLFNLLGHIDIKNGYINAIKGERATGLDILERIRNNGFEKSMYGWMHKPKRGNVIDSWTEKERSSDDELYFIDYIEKVVDDANKMNPNSFSQTVYDEYEFPEYALVSSIILPIYDILKLRPYEAMATISGDRTFLAVLVYKSKFGTYPQDLYQLERNLGWKLPLDPLGNGPFKYRREGKGFVIYGFGRNRKDDKASTVKALEKTDPGFSNQINKYPYINGDGTRSADMIWRKDK